jgi:hypothetical protein
MFMEDGRAIKRRARRTLDENGRFQSLLFFSFFFDSIATSAAAAAVDINRSGLSALSLKSPFFYTLGPYRMHLNLTGLLQKMAVLYISASFPPSRLFTHRVPMESKSVADDDV